MKENGINMADTILRGVSNDGTIRIFAAETTELVGRAQQIHHSYPIATAALGRLLTAAAMMGTMLKGERDTITLRVKGDGPLEGVLAVGNAKGEVKGYSVNPGAVLRTKCRASSMSAAQSAREHSRLSATSG